MPEETTGYDWSCFDVYLDIDAPAEDVYDAWATSRGMASFFAKAFSYGGGGRPDRPPGERAEAGDAYHLEFHHPLSFGGRVLEAEPPREFSFTFPDVMHVTVRLAPKGGFTRVHLRQDHIATDAEGMVQQHLNCRSCWIYYLMNLKSVLEHGHDLRDPDRPQPDNIISVAFHKQARAGELPA